jgi:hypothetical protein
MLGCARDSSGKPGTKPYRSLPKAGDIRLGEDLERIARPGALIKKN